jgi:AraC-like DNA-binding protein
MKMAEDPLFLVIFTMNIVYIVVSIYAFLLKVFYIPAAYKEVFGELFPARQTLANLYFMQVMELPYLFLWGRQGTLFCVNGAALLFLTSYLIILIRGYFFLDFTKPLGLVKFQSPVFICWFGLLLPIIGIVEFTPTYRMVMTIAVMVVEMWYIYLLNKERLRLMEHIRNIDEDEFSNDTDFPVKFAQSVKWMPLIVIMVLMVTFWINIPVVKMIRDIIMIIISVWFSLYTLNPHRNAKKLPQTLKKKDDSEEVPVTTKHRLTEKYCKETQDKLIDIIRTKKLYLEEHLTMNDLIDLMHTNKNYLSEVIARSEYKSFYRLINTMRIEHACEMLDKDSSLKLEQVAIESGFTSGSAFSQIFKRLMNVSPKEYISQIHAE